MVKARSGQRCGRSRCPSFGANDGDPLHALAHASSPSASSTALGHGLLRFGVCRLGLRGFLRLISTEGQQRQLESAGPRRASRCWQTRPDRDPARLPSQRCGARRAASWHPGPFPLRWSCIVLSTPASGRSSSYVKMLMSSKLETRPRPAPQCASPRGSRRWRGGWCSAPCTDRVCRDGQDVLWFHACKVPPSCHAGIW